MRAVDAGGAVVGQERWQTSPDKFQVDVYFNAQPTPRIAPDTKQKPSNALVSATVTFTGIAIDCAVDMTEEVRYSNHLLNPSC